MSNITTRNGDGGMTSLINKSNIPKSDERIHFLGDLDELTSHIGLVKSKVNNTEIIVVLERIQSNLQIIMSGIAEPHTMKHHLNEAELGALEEAMEHLVQFVKISEDMTIPGKNILSAELDVVRAVARRAERSLSAVTIKFGTNKVTKKYMNRLSDYLYLLARYAEKYDISGGNSSEKKPEKVISETIKEDTQTSMNDIIIQEVLKRIEQSRGLPDKMNLNIAKQLIEKVEAYALQQGLNAVIAVCGADGNPVAVHVMDNAFLVSFDVAIKKAYTSASVKMSTMELAKLIQPGCTFQGLDKLQGDKMVFFGGGVPLMKNGILMGALGISGGTGEEDDVVAQYGLKVFEELI